MADEAASPSKLSPGEEMEEAHYGIEEDNETKEFKVAQEAAAAAEGYDETKAQAQALKELLVRQPEWIKAIAMRLKAEAKRTVAAIEKEEQEQQNHRDSMVCDEDNDNLSGRNHTHHTHRRRCARSWLS